MERPKKIVLRYQDENFIQYEETFLGIKSRINSLRITQAAEKKTGAHQADHAKSDFHRNGRVIQAETAAGRITASRTFLQFGNQIRTGRL